jgi:flagellar hook-basal body complex protein FliE
MDVSKIDVMLAQLRTGAALAGGKAGQGGSSEVLEGSSGVDFSTALKNSLDSVNGMQQSAAKLARSFELGEPEANLTEAMIAMQKASLSFQYTIQVRNKLVAAYQEIMNMAV